MTEYDAIFIGAGQAGPFLAARMAADGQKVALIERKFLGGTCVNAGCMPTKTLVASAHAAAAARRAASFGVIFRGPIDVDMTVVKARAEKVTLDARKALTEWLGSFDSMSVIYGHALLEDQRTVVVNSEKLTAPRIFINVGARPTIPAFPGINEVDYFTSTSILQLCSVPEHLVVIGGSYIGLEFAQMYRRFGAKVTVIERGPRLLSREDDDVSCAVEEILRSEGVATHTSASGFSFRRDGDGVEVRFSKDTLVHGSHLLLAVGRTPNTDDLGLASAGVRIDDRGFIEVNDRLETSVAGIWALGDCNGRGAFTHTSYNDYEISAANLLDGDNRKLSDRIPAYALYIDPPLGRVGMTEDEARRSGKSILVSARPMSRVGRAVEKGETAGFMKLIADADTKQILGASVLGVGGDEVIHGIIDAKTAGIPFSDLKWAVPIHPTVSELFPTLIRDLRPM
ncbi:pyruvate/2-oxoglutarate dehydrogenase complex dihydrolipoamide dehydrogenase (E3) component [Pararhizobium capsulatum DSM 1112]|uniref:Pyruvate/2-oxoglutarate dehydrogenase complex dihydrolipoamide dehydrogenase (E3) component n=1 Tax=Pararhizobium capsulatum DSM 1112 TaxID=1121113 RepID=A0ABU0C0E8_9HYPH|nr:FAD-containing oxidoreductase [Pararhizobium capsulatum]MDQ0323998.1 pyruvate/2-oxoglutarate dehydrogenase complex dihydrolipoamide dehydrogenase (E3) component [Pararhizobium capsulatum DSM 1112]